MSDWQKGDLALCLNDGPITRKTKPDLIKGKVYLVEMVFTVGEYVGLAVEGATSIGPSGFLASRFRKIRPSAIKHIEALKEIPDPVRENEHA